jgi:surface protein
LFITKTKSCSLTKVCCIKNSVVIDPSVYGGGKIKSWLIEDSGKYNLYVGSERKIFGNYNSSFLFNNLTNMININLTNFDTTFASTLNGIFMSCSSIKNIDVSNWNTSNVKDMKNVFRGCNSLLSIDVSNWDVRKVSDMFCLFYVCSELKELDLSNWKVDNVTSMAYIFSDCYKLKTLNISNWDINKLTSTEGMLYANSVLNKVIINNSDYTSVNKIITNIESKRSESIGTISITGVDNISKVAANSKYWNII